MPWHQCRRSANTTRFHAPWIGRGPGDQARWGLEASSSQGGRQGRSGLGGRLSRFQVHPVASGPIGHEDPDFLVKRLPWYQAGGGTKTNEEAWDPGAACTSITKGPSLSRALDDLFLGGPSRSICHGRPGLSLPSAPGCRGDQAGCGTKVHMMGMGPWHLLEMQWLGAGVSYGTRCIEGLGRPATWVSCHLRQVGARGRSGPRSTKDPSS